MRTIAEVMTKDPVCCEAGDPVNKAAQLMKREDVGPIPVVESQSTHRLVGIVTDRDIAVKIVAEGKDARNTKVQEVMTPNPVTCHPEDDLQKALDAMIEHQIRRVPIVDHQDRIVGIVAQADVATRLHDQKKTGKVVEAISE
jgi:CBS domain-containing protein